ncbi:MAG: Ig-like domain-containing protein, partial [Lachnospiraceae bacterium]|nr:Ig-like domain-containing protein [Lachnospiraceae bacterium]
TFACVTCSLEAEETYYVYVSGSKISLYGIVYSYEVEQEVLEDIDLVEGTLAFPTAEGGGMYATGGRGGDVYVVTNLNDSGEGSLRYGIENAPDEGRIIVFSVGGTINLESTLTFKNKKNITIAGQTAPGDGITIAGYDTNISDSENIIIRYVRFRVGTANLLNGGDSMDALWGRDNDTFIIDHCSFSWNTDETLSTYRGSNGTVQWCIISESLTVSGHSKGRHGYGGIWGGDNTVFQYNLLANHTSRNPRIGGGSMGDPTSDGSTATLQLSNNVIYNYGYYPTYGGGYTYTNYINNYLRPGQGTRDSLLDSLLYFGENTKVGGVYYDGNVLEGNAEITADNSLGFTLDSTDGLTEVSDTAYEAEAFDNITLVSAEECYELVLNSAGATYPYRDAVDARVVEQVRTDTGTYINTPDEVGGYPAEDCVSDLVDTDGDGIPDEWETAHGLDPNDASDSRTLCTVNPDDATSYGYAWIEVYFNELVEETDASTYVAKNPTVTINLEDNTLVDEGDSVTVTATAAPYEDGITIEKVEFYNGSTVVGTVYSAPYTFTYTDSIAEDGTYYISVRAYDSEGNKTQSNTSRIYVNSTAGTGEWTSVDIGEPEVEGTASLVDGVLTVKGAGKIGVSEGSDASVNADLADATTDDFQFVYQELTGDMEIITKFDSYTPVDNHTFQGLMFRSSLEDDAATVALCFTMVKVDETTIWSCFMVNRESDGGSIQKITETIDSPEAAEAAGIPLIANLTFKEGNEYLGTWLKLVREGDTFTGYVSSDGSVWQKVGTLTADIPDTAYVGFAVDANKAANDLVNYNTAKFSNIEINTSFVNVTYDTENVDVSGSEKLAVGYDLAVTLTKVTGYTLPESVSVTIGGVEAVEGTDYTYDSETGIITVPSVQEDVVITASGVKRVVVPVEYEVIDDNNLLTITEENGVITLTQIAETGNIQTTGKSGGATSEAANVSYLLFPEVDEYHVITMDITVKSVTSIDGGGSNGFYVGAFGTEDPYVYSTFAFRGDMVAKGFWYKPGGDAGIYTGDGNPGLTPYSLDTTYSLVFQTDSKGGYYAYLYDTEGNLLLTKQFKAGESVLATGDTVRYGIAIIGATVEISNMTLTDAEGNMIYNQNSADYSEVTAAILTASSLNAADYTNYDAVLTAWDAVVFGLTDQDQVDQMAATLLSAIEALEPVESSEEPGDTGDDVDTSDNEDGDTSDWDEAIDEIENWQSGDDPITFGNVPGRNAIPNNVMKKLLENPDVPLVFEYSYDGADYTIVILPGTAVDDETEWYGPLWLYEHYGSYTLDDLSGINPDTANPDTNTDAAEIDSAATGDSEMLVFWLTVMAAAVCAVAVFRKRREYER